MELNIWTDGSEVVNQFLVVGGDAGSATQMRVSKEHPKEVWVDRQVDCWRLDRSYQRDAPLARSTGIGDVIDETTSAPHEPASLC